MTIREGIIRDLCEAKFSGRVTIGDMDALADKIFDRLLCPGIEIVRAGNEACSASEPNNEKGVAAVKGGITGYFAMIRAAKAGK